MMFKMDKSGILSGAVFSLLVLFATAADASLVQKIETLSDNSKLYTIVDNVNHQQWLDGWSTISLTYNQVTSQFSSGKPLAGYHVATTADLFALFGAAGLANELGYDQWGLKGDYFGARRDALASFVHLMGFDVFGPSYFTFDNGDLETYPIIEINSYDPYGYNYGKVQTIANLSNAGKDYRIGLGWGVSTLVVKNFTSVPESSGWMLALIAVAGLIFQRRFKLR